MTDGPLVSVEAAAGLLGDPVVRFADTRWYLGEPERGPAAYREAHLPGAVFVDLDRDLSAHPGPGRHPLPERPAFAATLGRLGIGDEHRVIAYDDRGGAVAARLWWMLRWIGHSAVQVLDGGLTAWIQAGLPTTAEGSAPGPARHSVAEPLTRWIDRDALEKRLGSLHILDARAPERYRGDEEPIDPIGGHIPTALNLPYEGNLDCDDRFLADPELAARFAPLGPDAVVYCGSGVTACHNVLAAVAAGLPEPMLYPGSWSDWSSEGMPIATGPEPGRPRRRSTGGSP